MVAENSLLARARPWLLANRSELLRALAVPLGLGLAWWFATLLLPATVWYGLIAYALAQITLRLANRQHYLRLQPALLVSVVADAALALVLLAHAAVLGAAIYPLYLLIALRVLAVYQQMPVATITPFVLGPAYLFAESISRQAVPPSGTVQSAQWSLMIGSLAFGVVAIVSSTVQQRARDVLRQELREAQLAADSRVAQLEHTARDLRARMRERHALEEGLRAITSTLSLDEVLSQIVDSTMQMLGTGRVHGIALSLAAPHGFDHRSYMTDDTSADGWAALLARRAVEQRSPLIVADVATDDALGHVLPATVRSALSVPLFIGDGVARGALSVISSATSVFSSTDARHLTAFAIQAGIAIGNAELHSRLERQQNLLGAVLRDISDGLVVANRMGEVVLTNPLGARLLNDDTSERPAREQIDTLISSIQTAEHPILTAEVRVGPGSEADDQTYQAIGSLVRDPQNDEPLVAIVLHDITAQKAEERSRSQFISMVAHELRNPLNSLNGFVKIVLQGRAGTLTPLQQEFLQIADTQVEQLKGRISELLEYNRLEAGRLTLAPQWNDLPLLVTGTVTRLRLQAEQAGLSLFNEFEEWVPECYFDSERIGQVLTNLVENAIKATPPGGTIRVRSQVYEDEVWVRVSDTGVGIPLDEQRKIFEPFVQGASGATKRGGHLGLGLAICKQIVEGHRGRLWVESESGQGSCFTFTLPLIPREAAVSA